MKLKREEWIRQGHVVYTVTKKNTQEQKITQSQEYTQ